MPCVDWSTVATFAAVGVALLVAFVPSILRWWNRPVATIDFCNDVPYCRYSRTTLTWNAMKHTGMAYWVRLQVHNSGKSVLRDCEGRLEAITDATSGKVEHDFDPSVLHWVGHAKGPIDINQKEPEYLDVFFLFEPLPAMYIVGAEDMTPRGIEFVRRKKHVRLSISVYGRNVSPVTFCLDVDFDRPWHQCKINGTPNNQPSLPRPEDTVPYNEPASTVKILVSDNP
jgi:hypothetical protein